MRHIALVLLLSSVAISQVETSRSGARPLPLPKEDGVWHFGVFGDRTGGPDAGIKILAQAVQDTNLLDPDLVMTVGDLIQGYNQTPKWMKQMQEFRDTMSKLQMPWYPVAGNHDVYWRGSKGGEKKPEGEHEHHYEEHFGPLWYAFQHKNAGFIVIYSDEGNPQTGEKSFGKPSCQQVSPAQLAWLEGALSKMEGLDHVFAFIHHPRWIKHRYQKNNWNLVHDLMAKAGNVTAVFAGHIHRMHYDQSAAGIEYYTLATTGGHIRDDFPDGGWLHHLNVVTVRKDRISVSSIPVGVVEDPRHYTQDFHNQMDALDKRPSAAAGHGIEFGTRGGARGTLKLQLSNPSSQPVEYAISVDPHDSRIAFFPDHHHVTVPAGAKRKIAFEYARPRIGFGGPFTPPTILEEGEWIGSGFRVKLPARSTTLTMGPGTLEAEPGTLPGVLHLDGRSSIAVPSKKIEIGKGPFTLEGWINAKSYAGRRPFLAKTESSEYAIFVSDGTATFEVHLGGQYRKATMPKGKRLTPGRWHHLAGVYDGKEVRLYVDGQISARTPGTGIRKRNPHPLWIGADPNASGKPVDRLTGRIDEVRLSRGVRYTKDRFTPRRRENPDPSTLLLYHLDRNHGPFVRDASPKKVHAHVDGPGFCAPDVRPGG